MVSSLLKKKISGRIDSVDITFILLNSMMWFFLANAWKDPLAATMVSASVLIFCVYFVARYTGILPFLEITKPFWTLSAIVSIPIWYITFLILPAPQASFTPELSTNFLGFFINPDTASAFLQSWGFGLTEGFLAAIFLSLFASFGIKRALGNKRRANNNIIVVVMMIAIFMSLLHVSVAAKLAQAGVYQPGVLFAHQLLSFGIMLVGAVLVPIAGVVLLLAPHVVKNLIANNASTGLWIGSFAVFILLDIMSFVFAKAKEKKGYLAKTSSFIK